MQPYVAIIKATGANYTSLVAAIKRLGITSRLTNNSAIIKKAKWVILPGVGSADYAMNELAKKQLINVIKTLKQPVLGICLGMQLLCSDSEEGDVNCLNIIPLKVQRLKTKQVLPHMGWNNFAWVDQQNPLLNGVSINDNFYFIHSYAPTIKAANTIAKVDYGIKFSAVINYQNFFGVQFHPEKSGLAGIKILQNFFNQSTIKIIPSIDLLNNNCVRLKQGKFNDVKEYRLTPTMQIRKFANAGAKFLHMVNLNAVQTRKINNWALLKKMRKTFPGTIQLGGGIRSIDDVKKIFAIGINRVVIGSLAITDPQLVKSLFLKYGAEKIVLALDLKQQKRNWYVAINGWKTITTCTFADVIKKYPMAKYILCTDISKDGMSKGCNQTLYKMIKNKYPQLALQASGGITTENEINTLKRFGIDGVIIGKALYEHKLDLRKVLKC